MKDMQRSKAMTATGNELVTLRQLKVYGGGM